MALKLESLKKSIDSLERAINAVNMVKADINANSIILDTLKSGVIQNFEVAYEQCWKYMQRWIRENHTPEDADHPRTRKELFRMAARFGLIPDPLPWFEYGDIRNLTSHTYDDDKANSAFDAALRFVSDAKFFLERLLGKND